MCVSVSVCVCVCVSECQRVSRYSVFADLLPDLLEAVQDGDAGDAVDLAQGVQADRVQLLLAGYLGVLYDGSGRVVHYHHRLVTLPERERERERRQRNFTESKEEKFLL